ncbi:MAG: hypothetical protein LBG77_01805, partial [Dysgonamonadaceae bacterium]|nr:hypothetical protein [Dysgonamonadaceae bacterium]
MQSSSGREDENKISIKIAIKQRFIMMNLSAKITINSQKKWVFDKISSVEIERDIEKVTATCRLVLPKRLKWKDETGIPLRRGDKIFVELGYNGNLQPAFSGYIKTIGAKAPVEIECEDEMFLLKNTAAKKKTYPNADLKKMLSEQLPEGLKLEVFKKQGIGKFVVNSDTVAQLLGELSKSGVRSFFKDGTLYCGMIFDHSATIGKPKPTYRAGAGGNIIDDDDLEQVRADDIRLCIKASGTDRNGKKIRVEVGDKLDGEIRSFFKYNTTLEQLKAEATAKLTEWKKDGLAGSFTTFGGRLAGLLDVIKIYPQGGAAVDCKVIKNTISFGNSGY